MQRDNTVKGEGDGVRSADRWAVRISYAVVVLLFAVLAVGATMLIANQEMHNVDRATVSACAKELNDVEKSVSNHEQRLLWLEDNIKQAQVDLKKGQEELLREVREMKNRGR